MAYIPMAYHEIAVDTNGKWMHPGDPSGCYRRELGGIVGKRFFLEFAGHSIHSGLRRVESEGAFQEWFKGCGVLLQRFLTTSLDDLGGFQHFGFVDMSSSLRDIILLLLQRSLHVHVCIEDTPEGVPVGCFAVAENVSGGKRYYDDLVMFTFRQGDWRVMDQDVRRFIDDKVEGSLYIEFSAKDVPGNRVVKPYRRLCQDLGGFEKTKTVFGESVIVFTIPGTLYGT